MKDVKDLPPSQVKGPLDFSLLLILISIVNLYCNIRGQWDQSPPPLTPYLVRHITTLATYCSGHILVSSTIYMIIYCGPSYYSM